MSVTNTTLTTMRTVRLPHGVVERLNARRSAPSEGADPRSFTDVMIDAIKRGLREMEREGADAS